MHARSACRRDLAVAAVPRLAGTTAMRTTASQMKLLCEIQLLAM